MSPDDVAEALDFAKRIAWSMWNDVESESVAGEALVYALRTYDPEKGDFKRWVARHTKLTTWDYMRRFKARHSETRAEEFWELLYEAKDDFTDIPLPIPRDQWELLVEYYLENVPLDVVAKLRNVSVYRVRKMMDQATESLLDAKI